MTTGRVAAGGRRRSRWSAVQWALASLLAGAPALADPTTQDFDDPGAGTAYHLSNFSGTGAEVYSEGPNGTFLRLAECSGSNLNTVAFDRTAEGTYTKVAGEFRFRMSPCNWRADGLSFALLNTAIFGVDGDGPAISEDPALAGSIAVGLDIHQNEGEPSYNHVRVGFDNAILADVDIDLSRLDLADGVFHQASVTVEFVRSGALVTMTFDGAFTPLREFLVPGVAPYESRAALGARTGGAWASHDVDDIVVVYQGFLGPCGYEKRINMGGWATVDSFGRTWLGDGETAGDPLDIRPDDAGGAQWVGIFSDIHPDSLEALGFNGNHPGDRYIFNSIRWDDGGDGADFRLEIPAPAGAYTVNLYFVEGCRPWRRFKIEIQGTILDEDVNIDDYDPASPDLGRVGRLSFDGIEVAEDGLLRIGLLPCWECPAVGDVNPIISAIEIRPSVCGPRGVDFTCSFDPGTGWVRGVWRPFAGADGYRVLKDGVPFAAGPALSFTDPAPGSMALVYTLQPLEAGAPIGECSCAVKAHACAGDLVCAFEAATGATTLTWTPASSGIGYAGYEVSRNGEVLALVGASESTYLDAGGGRGASYSVRAIKDPPEPEPALCYTMTCNGCPLGPPESAGGWIPTDRWLLLFPLLNPSGCDAGGVEGTQANWVAPYDIGREDPKLGDVWDIDFGGAAASTGWGGSELFPEPTWTSVSSLAGMGRSPAVGDSVDFANLVPPFQQYVYEWARWDFVPCTETTDDTIVKNGSFEVGGSECVPEGWEPDWGWTGMCTGASPELTDCAGAVVAERKFGEGLGGAYYQTITLEPDTEYVLSAYLWCYGSPDYPVNAVVDLDDAPYEAQLTLDSYHWDVSEGHYLYGNFFTAQTGTELTIRVFLETWGALPSPEQVGARWDNIAITPASQFRAPSVWTPGPTPRVAAKDVLGIAETQVENRTGAPVDVLLCASSDDAHQLWLNGTVVGCDTSCAGVTCGCGAVYPATLEPGGNKLTALVWNGNGDWKFQLRVIRASDGHIYTAADHDELAFIGTATPMDLPMDEGAGDVAFDRSGAGIDGTISGAEWVRTPLGFGLKFDGVDDHVDISRAGDFIEGTIQAWVKPGACGDEREIVSGLMTSDFEVFDCEVRVMDGNWDSPDGPWLSSGSFLDPTRWSHVASTFDGLAWRLYVDGEERASFDIPFYYNAAHKLIGQWYDGGPWNWIGTIDEVRIDTHALTPEEIFARYVEDLARFERFVRGDADGDGAVNVSDAVRLLKYLFAGRAEIPCMDAADANDDGKLGLDDSVHLLLALFSGRTSVPSPSPDCGPDPTDDLLGCDSYRDCP